MSIPTLSFTEEETEVVSLIHVCMPPFLVHLSAHSIFIVYQTQRRKVVLILTELTTGAFQESSAQEHCLGFLLKTHTPELLSWNL